MRFNAHVLFLLCTFLNLFVMVFSDEQQDFDSCYRACNTEFCPVIVNLLTLNHTYSNYEKVVPYWTNCQYRCYRCGLANGIYFMDELKRMFDDRESITSRATLELIKLIAGIETSLKECYDKWIDANINGDTTAVF